MKKWSIIAVAAVAALCLALVGCGGSSSGNSGASNAKAGDSGYTLLKEGTLTVGTSPDYPPFENLEGDDIVGFEADLANAIGEKLGLTVEFKTLQFDAIIPAVVSGGQCDVGFSGFSITPERQKEVDFTTSYFVDDLGIAVMKTSTVTEENMAAELNAEGIKIAVQTGTTGESYIQETFPNATVQGYGNSNDCFAALQAGQADAVCTNAAVVSSMVSKSYTDAQIIKTVATGEEYAAVINKDNAALTEAINKAIEELKADGSIDKMMDTWF